MSKRGTCKGEREATRSLSPVPRSPRTKDGRGASKGEIPKETSPSGKKKKKQPLVFTEQGSSASQMTAAKVLDVIARLPGCAGQASHAVSAYTQVKMEDAPTLLELPKSECPDIWRRLPRYKWQKRWQNIEEPVVPFGKEFVRTILCKFATENTVRKSSTRKWMGESTNLGMSVVCIVSKVYAWPCT